MPQKKTVTKRLSHEAYEPGRKTAGTRLAMGKGKRKDVKKLGTAGRVAKAKLRMGDSSEVPEIPPPPPQRKRRVTTRTA